MVNTAWRNRKNAVPIDDGMGGKIYNIPFNNAGYKSGYTNTGAQMDYIRCVAHLFFNFLDCYVLCSTAVASVFLVTRTIIGLVPNIHIPGKRVKGADS